MCELRITGKFKNYSYICAHAPKEEKCDRQKDQFYEQLEKMYKKCSSYDTKIVVGDMKAKVGKETWARTVVGICDFHDESNDNGTHLTNYAVHQHMVTGGTLLQHRNIHKGTWHGHDSTFN
jgi:hypothetical protein